MKRQPLYHVTGVDCIESILRDGLRGGTKPRNRGNTLDVPSIFSLTSKNLKLAAAVAIGQIWPSEDIAEYALFRISSKGITGEIVTDDVGEQTAPWHRVIRQDVIHPRHLKLIQRVRLDYPGVRLWQLLYKVMLKKGRKLDAEEWALAPNGFSGSGG